MKGPSINFEHVNLSMGSTSILEDVSFTIESGTIHCITGPNGAGKSSLIKSLLGEMPHRGKIQIEWNEEKGHTGYVPQTIAFDRSLPITVMDFMKLMTFQGGRKKSREKIEVALESVSMKKRSRRLVGELSGGELKRTLLAQALINRPSLLILDEPSAGLDEEGEHLLLRSLMNFRKSGGTILWICHDTEKIEKYADKVTVIKKKIIYSGKPDREEKYHGHSSD